MAPFNGNTKENILRQMLIELRDQHGCCGLKLSTEDAGNSFDDIQRHIRLFGDILPIAVKIGGPNARNDIKTLVAMGIRSLIAPMVESVYGLQNYIEALQETLSPEEYKLVSKRINVETITAYHNFKDLTASLFFAELNQITVGRGDLSQSMGHDADDPRVMKAARDIIRQAHALKIPVSVGGRINPENAAIICRELKPDEINTREIGLSLPQTRQGREPTRNVYEAVKAMLEFETAFLEYQISILETGTEPHRRRLTKLRERNRKKLHIA